MEEQHSHSKENMYEKYIIPYINSAKRGSRILFISPSTFFGFYTLGAKNFEQVCGALNRAKDEGVEIKLIIDVHDSLTAKAAEGLLTFLTDGREIRHFEGNTDLYNITIYNQHGTSRHVEFISERPRALRYLPGVQTRPYGGLKSQPNENMSYGDVQHICAIFDQIWNRSEPVGSVLTKYTVAYQARRYLAFFQGITYLAVLVVGLVTGTLFSIQGQPQSDMITVLVWLAASLGVGVLGNYLSNFIMRKLFG